MRFVSPLDALLGDIFVGITGIGPNLTVQLKIEGFNMAGSIKLKPAIQMVEDLEYQGRLTPGKRIIESSSGNLGVALSLVGLVKGYPFTCISDPNISPQNRRLIEAYGGRIIVVTRTDANGGYLNTRIALIQDMLATDSDLIWVNQYANPANKAAHIRWTAPEILRAFPNVDLLFIGAGTTGTLMGCAQHVRRAAPWVKIIAVDSEGSVTFGFPPGKRYIPGLPVGCPKSPTPAWSTTSSWCRKPKPWIYAAGSCATKGGWSADQLARCSLEFAAGQAAFKPATPWSQFLRTSASATSISSTATNGSTPILSNAVVPAVARRW